MTQYTIVGAGAIGGTIGHALAAAGHEILLVDTDAAHIAAISDKGLTLRSGTKSETVAIEARLPADVSSPLERVLLAVKTQATGEAMRWIAPRLSEDGYVVSLQNGFNEEEIVSAVGRNRVVSAFVNLFADLLGPGVLRDGGSGALVIGEMHGQPSARVDDLVADLQAWGPAISSSNVEGYLWAKSGFGAMLAATALADDAMGELLNRHRPASHRLAAEVFTLADRHNIKLEAFDAFTPEAYRAGVGETEATDALVAWLRTQAKDRSGIWYDLAIRRRPTEFATQASALLTDGEAQGVEMPVLTELLHQIRDVERDPDGMAESRLDELDRVAFRAIERSAR